MLPRAQTLNKILTEAVDMGASDIHLSEGAPPKCRVYGLLKTMKYDTISSVDIGYLFKPLLDAYARKNLDSTGQWDLSYSIHNVARFRVNIYKQKGGLAGVFRILNDTVPSFDKLGLPISLQSLTTKRRGFVLVTGPTGSGKSTTLASLIDTINKNMYKHIITLEDPIEYLHWHNRCNVSQREIGTDCSDFQSGVRAALREDPDIILVGEMRDLETMETALVSAETGHLVLSTLHTIGAVETVNRVLDTFPEKRHAQVRSQLASTIEAIVSQQLMPRKDGKGYIVAYEILYRSKEVQNLIRENNVVGLDEYLRSDEASKLGMCCMDDVIFSIYRRGIVDRNTALEFAMDRKYMQSKINSL